MSPASIEIQVLGELSVRSGAAERPLPRSRKTRALLGYLALTGRAHRREQLCDLFWDVTDDPRAALRWSLSKLRKVLERPGAPCLIAPRTHVHVQLASGALDADTSRSERCRTPGPGSLSRVRRTRATGWNGNDWRTGWCRPVAREEPHRAGSEAVQSRVGRPARVALGLQAAARRVPPAHGRITVAPEALMRRSQRCDDGAAGPSAAGEGRSP